ncbi:hypothetical protein BB560_005533 [Smittium megazygosporum]|uniref:DNL-type domain-containing protein n=1 Tax=Smittium megazygosporum TaxID=133381 RepID=A0A2T9Z3R6_9FUNG|nr:hypothetical protein BB560_005533 [Smittium megazygosporum]
MSTRTLLYKFGLQKHLLAPSGPAYPKCLPHYLKSSTSLKAEPLSYRHCQKLHFSSNPNQNKTIFRHTGNHWSKNQNKGARNSIPTLLSLRPKSTLENPKPIENVQTQKDLSSVETESQGTHSCPSCSGSMLSHSTETTQDNTNLQGETKEKADSLESQEKGDGISVSSEESAKKAKFLVGFTCKVCNHRQYKMVSKKAYTSGVVLIRCEKCRNNHLFADHLGWFKDSGTTIEDIMAQNGEKIKTVIDADLLHYANDYLASDSSEKINLADNNNSNTAEMGNVSDSQDKKPVQ